MHLTAPVFCLTCVLVLFGTLAQEVATTNKVADPGWPRVFKQGTRQLTVHQPQIDRWLGYTNLQFRCAIAVSIDGKEEKFGAAEVEAQTVTDHEARTVTIFGTKRVLRFGNTEEKEAATLRATVDEIYPTGQVVVLAVERVLAYLEPKEQRIQRAVKVNLKPPTIFTSSRPAILVSFMGKPQFRPVDTNRTDLEFALNCNWDVLYATKEQQFYLLNGDSWLTTWNLLKNEPWSAASNLPGGFGSLPKDDNWANLSKHVHGTRATRVPTVFVTTKPAELILLDGPPKYAPVPGTKLERVTNTQSVLFLDSTDRRLYYLIAGRWFRAEGLSGPWVPASENLPADFARIPDGDPSSFVKASVPGTTEAKDAVLLASIPKMTVVSNTTSNVTVSYTGEPKFQRIENTDVQYAVNSPTPVFLIDGRYYCCIEGCFFTSSSANGPWTVSTNVPAAIASIPPSHPMHHVTYVEVQEATDDYVSYEQTSGYWGEYVAPTGVLMYGSAETGMGEAEAAPEEYYYWYAYPFYYTYGIGASYHYGYGGYYGARYAAYGPYGGVGVFAGYNPYTGAYARSVDAYGMYGSASRTAAYNPNSGGFAMREEVSSLDRSAARGAAYNPMTGEGAIGAKRSSQYGTAAALKTTQGSATAWRTQSGQGVAAKAESGNVFAATDGSVYMKDSNGNWWHNSGSGWINSSRPQPAGAGNFDRQAVAQRNQQQAQARANAQQQQVARQNLERQQILERQQNLERQAQVRQAANRQSARVNQYRGGNGRAGGGAVRGGRR